MKKAVLTSLAVALLLSTALPLLAAPTAPAPSAAPVPVWLAGLTPAGDAGLQLLPQPIFLTACSFPDQSACTQDCRQSCQPCHSSGGTCTLENGCVCGECICK